MAWGRRCELGCESWPDQVIFSRCPTCGEPTTRYRNLRPLDTEEALSMKLHSEFELYYERYCAQRGQSTDGPLVDPPVALLAAGG